MALKDRKIDPLAYIESAFLDTNPIIHTQDEDAFGSEPIEKAKFRKTKMRAPRPRRAREVAPSNNPVKPEIRTAWESMPKNIEFLIGFFDDSVTANYYTGDFKESREDLIYRLLDPELSLEETSRLLGVCPATVRRYTNRGWLHHHRTQGGQRRFRLSSIAKFVEAHGRFPEEA